MNKAEFIPQKKSQNQLLHKISSLDLLILSWLKSSSSEKKFWKAVTATGIWPFYLFVLVGFWLAPQGGSLHLKIAPISLIPSLVSWGLSTVLKKLIRRPRPHGKSLDSFPSSHAAASWAWTSYIAITGNAFVSLFVCWSLLIVFSRLKLRVHYFSDVVAGALIGIIVGLVFGLFPIVQ